MPYCMKCQKTLKDEKFIYKKLLSCLLVVAMVFVSGGAHFTLPVEADSISAEKDVPFGFLYEM